MISVTLGGIVRVVFRTVRPLFLFFLWRGGGQGVGDNKYQKIEKNDKLICLAAICYLTFFFAHCYNIDLKKLL